MWVCLGPYSGVGTERGGNHVLWEENTVAHDHCEGPVNRGVPLTQRPQPDQVHESRSRAQSLQRPKLQLWWATGLDRNVLQV